MNLEALEQLVKTRRSVRHYKPDPLPEGVLDRLLDATRWTPSGYNLQPTHFYVVTEPALKAKLRAACMDQPQVTEAPAVVAFVGDRDVYRNNFERVLQAEKAAGSINDVYEAKLRKFIPLAFDTGPAGFGWLWKCFEPAASYALPTPSIPAVRRRFWLSKQVMLSAMTFMLAAHAAGLATVPMEGFDERRVKVALGIPRRHVVPVVIPVGYSADGPLQKTRLPLESMVHRDGW